MHLKENSNDHSLLPKMSSKNEIFFRWNPRYFAVFLLVLAIEVFIAFSVSDRFIRPFFGDALVVVLMYGFFRSFLGYNSQKILIGCLLFAYCVEILQAFHVGKYLGLGKIAMIILGSTFDWMDLVAYSLGGLCIYIVEWRKRKL